MGKNNYSAVKGRFVQDKINDGLTKRQANNKWGKSEEKKNFDKQYPRPYLGEFRGNVDRSNESPMQDWAETSEDF